MPGCRRKAIASSVAAARKPTPTENMLGMPTPRYIRPEPRRRTFASAPWVHSRAVVARTEGRAIAPNQIHVLEPVPSGWEVSSHTYRLMVANPRTAPRIDSLRHLDAPRP